MAWWGSSTTGGGEEETLPEVLSSVACNCERMNVINYIFNRKESEGDGTELEMGIGFGSSEPDVSLQKGKVLRLKEGEAWLHSSPYDAW